MHRLNKKFVIFGSLAVACILLGWFLYANVFAQKPPTPTPSAPVTRGDIEETILASGSLEAFRQVNVGAQVSGQLKSLKVTLGQEVKQGDLVAEIDSLTQQNALKDAESALKQVRAQLRAQEATLTQAELKFKREERLFTIDASSRENYEAAQAALTTAHANKEALQSQLEQATIKVSTAKLDVGYTRILAPIDGRVVAIVTKEGQTVNSAQSAPTVIVLAELDTMTVKARVSEADVVRVKPGQTAYFSLLGNPDARFYGTLHTVALAPDSIRNNTDDSKTTTEPIYYSALFDVPNPDDQLRISMTAQVSIVVREAKNALLIPPTALLPTPTAAADGRRQVNVLLAGHVTKDGGPKTEARWVKVGVANHAQVEVLEGLLEGEQVVIGGDVVERAMPAGDRVMIW